MNGACLFHSHLLIAIFPFSYSHIPIFPLLVDSQIPTFANSQIPIPTFPFLGFPESHIPTFHIPRIPHSQIPTFEIPTFWAARGSNP